MIALKIKSLKANNDFTLDILLSNGKTFIFDIKPYLSGSGLKKLKNISFFKQAKFRNDVVYWDDMHDFPLHCMNIPKQIFS